MSKRAEGRLDIMLSKGKQLEAISYGFIKQYLNLRTISRQLFLNLHQYDV